MTCIHCPRPARLSGRATTCIVCAYRKKVRNAVASKIEREFKRSQVRQWRDAALQRSLVNRLRQQLPMDGSMLFSMRWKPLVTVAGRSVSRLQVSALRTADNGYGSWATPTTRDHKDGHAASCQNVPVNCLLGRQIHLCGSPAETAGSGPLNPAFSLWLQGYPTAWARCAARVIRSSRKSRQPSFTPTKR